MPTQPTKSMTPETDALRERIGTNHLQAAEHLCNSLELRLNAALAEAKHLNNVRLAALKAAGNDNLYLAHRILSNNNVEGVNKENAIDSAIQSTNKPSTPKSK